MNADDDRLDRSLAALGDGEFDDAGLDQRVAAFRESLRRLRRDPAEAARIDALARDAEQGAVRTPAAGALAGRAQELAVLTGLMNDAARGSGGPVLIEGEPGIGKTALVRAAIAALPPGSCRVLWGAGDELGQELPLLPFLDALGVRRASANPRRAAIAALLRGEAAAGRGADVPAVLAEQLIALTIEEAAARPVILVIDDLQWADAASVRLWRRLASAAKELPLLLVGLARPVPLREDVTALRRAAGGSARISLAALPQPAVEELARGLSGGRPDTALLRLAASAAGNPLYLTELFAALARSGGITVTSGGSATLTAGTVPDSLPAAIADRLGFVSAPAMKVLRAAALLGVEFAVDDLATVLGRLVTDLVPALDEARFTGVLTDSRMGLAFRHPLIRDALYAELPPAVRGAWHRDAARALAAAGAPPDRVARQLLRADPWPAGGPGDAGVPPAGAGMAGEWVLDWLAASADVLVSQAPGVAAELLAQAAEAAPAGSARRGWLASRLADACYRAGERAAAEETAGQALSYAADPGLIVDLHWTLVQCHILAGRPEESFAALDRALATPGITARHRARLLVLAARADLYYGNHRDAGREAERALAAAGEAGDSWAASWALHMLADLAVARGEMAAALPLCDRGLAMAETDPALTDLRILLQVSKAAALGSLGRQVEALETARRARNLAGQVGTAAFLSQAHGVSGQVLFDAGHWDQALSELAAVPEALKDPVAACHELGIAALIGLHRNKPDAARRHLAATEPYAKRVGQRLIPHLLLARSLDREQAGALPEALAVLTAAFAHHPDDVGETQDLLGDAVRLAVKTGDSAAARTLASQAAALAEGSQVPYQQANAEYCLGMTGSDSAALLAAAGRYADAGRPLPRAKALEAAAQVLVENDEIASARDVFNQAVDVYEDLGAEADVNRVLAEFRQYGIRRGSHARRPRAASGWDSLTEMELKVAGLVADGLSNPEIAERLTISKRTVGTHVSHILKKLEVATRMDIAREETHAR
jgi:DNA-binding CsgD family transcriptional regulator